MVALKNFSFAQLLKGRSLTLGSSLATLGSAALLAMPAPAQITPDATLGDEGSVVVPDAFVRGDLADLIEGGAVRGENLFHSFLEFNVGDGQRVYFANPDGIGAILSRITGSDPSNIFGTLGVDGSADLFFLNPNGILFGEDAVLDIEGSFYGTTADAIELGDAIFSAVEPGQSRLLTVDPGVLIESYLSSHSGNIENRGQLVAGETLSLAANRLNLQGQLGAGVDLRLVASDTVQIRDSAAVPFVALAGGDLLVQGNQRVDMIALSHAESGLYAYGNLVLRSPNPVGGDIHSWSGGDFRVEGLDGSAGDLFSSVDPIIRTLGGVVFDAYQGTSLHILAGGSVTMGTAEITGPATGTLGVDALQETVVLSDGTQVSIDGGAQPTLDIRAGVSPEAIGTPPLELLSGFDAAEDTFGGEGLTTVEPTTADITVGDVRMSAPGGLVLLSNQYAPNPTLTGGNIWVTGQGAYGYGIDARGSGGQGGTVFLDGRADIGVTNSLINTSGSGEVGDIVLLAEGTVSFSGQGDSEEIGARSDLESDGEGRAGNVRIQAANLEVLEGALLSAGSLGLGDAGNVTIEVSETARFNGISGDGNFPSTTNGAISSAIGSNAEGTGGDVFVRARNLEVTNGAQLISGIFGRGDAGDVIIEVSETARFDESWAASGIAADAEGTGGDVFVRARNLEVTNGAQLVSASLGLGDAGNVIIEAIETARFDGESSGAFSAIVGPDAEGTGGDVFVRARNLEVTNGAELNSASFGRGNAGDVTIEVSETARFDGESSDGNFPSTAFSAIGADAEGTGGDVFVRARNLEVTNGAELNSASFGRGDAGNVTIEVSETARFDGESSDGIPSAAFSSIESGGEGTGGDVFVRARNLEVTNGAQMISGIFGRGDAGDVIIEVSETARFDESESWVASGIGSDAEGTGGDVFVRARNLEVTNGAQLISASLGLGDAGNVIIEAIETARFDGESSGAFSAIIGSDAEGTGGNVFVRARNLEVTNGAELNSASFGRGDAGNVTIEVSETARFDGESSDGNFPSTAFSSIESGGEGTGGDIIISAQNLEVLQGATLSAINLNIGNAGKMKLVIADQILVDDGTIATNAVNGLGGQVTIRAGNLILRNDGDIQTFVAGGEGQGGNITILADFAIALDDSDILAFSADGRGGNIDLSQTPFFGENPNIASQVFSAADLFALDGNDQVDINASGRTASGQITIDETDFVENSLTETSGNLVSTVTFTEDSCISGSFTVTGGGGLPQKPGEAMISTYTISTVQTLPEMTTTTRPVLQQPDGVYRLADGRLVLSHQCGSAGR